MPWGGTVSHPASYLQAMVHEGIPHGRDGGGTRLDDICCTVVYSSHGHRLSCSVMLELGSRAPIVIKSANGPLSRQTAGFTDLWRLTPVDFFL